MSDKISPRPWELKINEDEEYWMEDINEIWMFNAFYDENVEHFLKCVNEHDSLVAEVERLKNELNIMLEQEEKRQGFTDAVMDENNKLNIQNKQLREALRQCSPYVFIRCTPCKFCRVPEGNGHTEDCEYIKLLEGK